MAETTQRRDLTARRPIAWALSGLGFVSLIDDLDLVKITGWGRDWLDAYQYTVERISGFLFGWIDWWWLGVSTSEAHALVLSIVLVVGVLRGVSELLARYGTGGGESDTAVALGHVFYLLVWCTSLVAAVLLPDPLGWPLLLLTALAVVFLELVVRQTGSAPFVPQHLSGTLLVFVVIVALDKMLLQ